VGDEVVVLQTDGQSLVIASLARRPVALRLRNGAEARLVAQGTALELKSSQGAVLFRYEASEQGSHLHIEADRLSLASLRGDLELSSAANVTVQGQRVSLRGGATDAVAVLSADGVELRGRKLHLQSEDAHYEATRSLFRSAQVRAELGDVHVRVERLETVAQQVVQYARNLYQRVEEVAQQRAGTLRMLIDQTWQVRAKRALTRTQETFKVRAETIHLG
jgi:hypothetical protein